MLLSSPYIPGTLMSPTAAMCVGLVRQIGGRALHTHSVQPPPQANTWGASASREEVEHVPMSDVRYVPLPF